MFMIIEISSLLIRMSSCSFLSPSSSEICSSGISTFPNRHFEKMYLPDNVSINGFRQDSSISVLFKHFRFQSIEIENGMLFRSPTAPACRGREAVGIRYHLCFSSHSALRLPYTSQLFVGLGEPESHDSYHRLFFFEAGTAQKLHQLPRLSLRPQKSEKLLRRPTNKTCENQSQKYGRNPPAKI